MSDLNLVLLAARRMIGTFLRCCLMSLAATMGVGAIAAAQSARSDAPLSLRALFDTVAATHPLIGAARSRTRAAQGGRIAAGAFGNPVLSVQVDNTPFPGGKSLTGLDRETMTTATLPLEFLYQRGPRVREADAMLRAAEADALGVRQRVAMDAADAWYRAALAQVGVTTSHDLVAWLDTLVAYNRARAKEGAVAEADFLRSELERDRAAADATIQDVELTRARAALASFLGDPRHATALPNVLVTEHPLPLATINRQSSVSLMIDQRPDVRGARSRLDASRAAITGEQSLILRQLGATLGTKQTAGTTSMIAGLSLPIPLFDLNRGQLVRANAERDAATLEVVAQERAAAADILGAQEVALLLTDRAAILTSGGTQGFLARADEARRIALGAYREGAVPLLQVLDAARAWGEARLTFYRTLFAQHGSVLALLSAQGIDLFANLPVPASPAVPNR